MTRSLQEAYNYTDEKVYLSCTNGNTLTVGKAVFLATDGDAEVADTTTAAEFPDGLFHADLNKIVTHGKITVTGHSLGAAGTVLYADTGTDGDLTTTRPIVPDDDYIIRMGVIVDENTLFVAIKVEGVIGSSGSGNAVIISDGLTGSTTLGLVYYIGSSGALTIADKDTNLTGKVFVIGTGETGEGCMNGELEVSGLTADTYYYLGDNGALTATAPTASGDTVLGVGWTTSTTLLKIQFTMPIYIS